MVLALVALALLLLAGLEARRSHAAHLRVRALNRGLHELRRPLQSLVLLTERPRLDAAAMRSCLEQARGALAGLDATINGRTDAVLAIPVSLGDVAADLDRRWRRYGVNVHAPRADCAVVADPVRLGAAVDNLVANALDHGTGRVDVRTTLGSETARIEVRDEGPAKATGRTRDPHRGHGLVIAADSALQLGGELRGPSRSAGGGTLAAISLPRRSAEAG